MTEVATNGKALRQVAIIRPVLESALAHLLQNRQAVAFGQAGVNRTPTLTEMICRQLRPLHRASPPFSSPGVFITLERGGGAIRERRLEMLRLWGEQMQGYEPIALLSLEREPRRGELTAVFLSPAGKMEPAHVLKIVGPGLERVLTPEGQTLFPEPDLTSKDREKFSRLIGVLGEESFRRLRALRISVAGVGRTGSLVVSSLARMGVHHMTLIDPDRLDLHNLDAMNGVTERDVGRLKVSGVGESAVTISGFGEETRTIGDSITTLRAFVAAKEADILISCLDHDGARLATGIIAVLYAKPLLDIGTGVFQSGGRRQMGGDIRLILPGERCIMCLGGVANLEQARTIFGTQSASLPPRRPWQEERTGSLRSLNEIAAHLGLRLLEDLVGEKLQHSTWEHLEFDDHGLPSLQIIAAPANPDCHLCHHTGEGDEGLASIRGMELALAESTTS